MAMQEINRKFNSLISQKGVSVTNAVKQNADMANQNSTVRLLELESNEDSLIDFQVDDESSDLNSLIRKTGATLIDSPKAVTETQKQAGIQKNENAKKFDNYVDTKDGTIGYTKQHDTGDCWLLSSLNALSYSDMGKELIKNSLEYKDGYTIVHLRGANDYIVTDDAISATKATSEYSSGDDDMIIFELAVEQFMDDAANGKVNEAFLRQFGNSTYYSSTEEHSSLSVFDGTKINGNYPSDALYWLTGKASNLTSSVKMIMHDDGTSEIQTMCYSDVINEELNKFQQNKNSMALLASLDSPKTVCAVDGGQVYLTGPHAYAIKDVTDETITIINPWDSSKDIVLGRNIFIQKFSSGGYLTSCDLTQKDEPESAFKQKNKIEYDDNHNYFFSDSDDSLASEFYNYMPELAKYNNLHCFDEIAKDSKYCTKKTYFDDDGNIFFIQKNDDQTGRIKEAIKYDTETGNMSDSIEYYPDVSIPSKVNKFDVTTGNVIETKEYALKHSDMGTSPVIEKVTVCDPKTGNPVKISEYDPQTGKLLKVSKCDPETGGVSKVTTFDENGAKKQAVKYDSKTGKAIKQVEYDETGKALKGFTYDPETGKTLKYVVYDKNGKQSEIYKYNLKNGELEKIVKIDTKTGKVRKVVNF